MANTQSLIPPNIDYGKISADKYDPDGTYTKGDLRIQNNALWKAKQDIDVPEPWTESHWESTTLAAELSSINSRSSGSIGNNGSVVWRREGNLVTVTCNSYTISKIDAWGSFYIGVLPSPRDNDIFFPIALAQNKDSAMTNCLRAVIGADGNFNINAWGSVGYTEITVAFTFTYIAA